MRRGLPVPPARTAGPLRVPAPASPAPTVAPPGSGPSGPLPLVVLIVVIVIVIVIVIVGIFIAVVVALVQRVDTGIDRPRARSGTLVGLLRMRAELFG
ncbi:hypothetical protein AQJ27_17955 [Streptomyces olivochromogenes]|uniref:Uncharacterized protein n=1 Tax=Streptomyces olivochromogenes TaxID=1963 RepID=A0A250V7C9_STROL|nr:hypothetical protein [Streptomyces olivochromogenes]KUN45945.1 hypothetical protein AQJ27_17955 [Streptomyces olivochromogenes]GAX49926.1 hypothetical protein SO3561_01416 [Streptomyces olivochromogenes]